MKDNDVVIYKLMDEFNRSREAIVQFLRNKGFSCEQAHAKIMRYQSETQIAYREFKNTGFTDGGVQYTMEDDENDIPPPPPPPWKGEEKINLTYLNETA